MLDARIYRIAFVPAVFAMVVLAFTFLARPAPVTSRISADAFDGPRAFGQSKGRPIENSLAELAQTFAKRRPGSSGENQLANRVATSFSNYGFRVRRARKQLQTAVGKVDSEIVVGVRPGLTSRRIVLVADRSALASPATAQLSGTAALLELARLLHLRETSKTLVLASTSGGPAGQRALAKILKSDDEPVDGLIALGNIATVSSNKLWVIPWSANRNAVSLRFIRSVEAAVDKEMVGQQVAPGVVAQFVHRAVPLTVSGAGELAAQGLPAVELQSSGELNAAGNAKLSADRFTRLGRATLSAVLAIDSFGARNDTEDQSTADGVFGRTPAGITVAHKVLSDTAVRFFVLLLLLPALIGSLDCVLRLRRHGAQPGIWSLWVLGGGATLVAGILWLRFAGLLGLLHAPPAPQVPGDLALGVGDYVWLALTAVFGSVGWFCGRRIFPRVLKLRGSAATGGPAAATIALLAIAVSVTWILNPYCAALLIPAMHLWLFAAVPESGLRGWTAWVTVVSGLLLPLFAFAYLTFIWRLDPIQMLTTVGMAFTGGRSLGTMVLLVVLAGCLSSVCAIVRARTRVERDIDCDDFVTRGPLSYAGPGSLGGVSSALRSR